MRVNDLGKKKEEKKKRKEREMLRDRNRINER
jgi:hypothetical protein